MDRRYVLGVSIAAALAVLPSGAFAQQKSIKDQLVGAWTLLLVDGIDAEGTHKPLYGPNPDGSMIFTSNGRYAVEVLRTINRPRFASNNRDTGTAEENKAAVQGALAYFGTYTVDEAGKMLFQRIEGSTFPNQEGTRQGFKIVEITDEVMTNDLPVAQSSIPGANGIKTIEVIWKKIK
jgi:hypothetical protein